MRVLLFADFRSLHARGWAAGLENSGLEVIRVSSELTEDTQGIVQPADVLARLRAFLLRRRKVGAAKPRKRSTEGSGSQGVPEWVHTGFALLRYPQRALQLRRLCRLHQPDVVHALRLPYEGVTALTAGLRTPVVVSTWGQDFVPQAETSPVLGLWAKVGLRRASGLHYDSVPDKSRAISYGFSRTGETLFAAGNFGVDGRLFFPSTERESGHVVFPRGPQAVANGETFIEAVKKLSATPGLTFTAVGLEGVGYAEKARALPELNGRLTLTSKLSLDDFARVIRSAAVVVSPATSDGTPISLISALAAGAPVVAGRIPSIVHLAESVDNLYLVEPKSADAVAAEVLRVIATSSGKSLMPEAFSVEANLHRVPDFYRRVLNSQI